jgi:hypothetical protein
MGSAHLGQWEYHSSHGLRSEAELTSKAPEIFAPNYRARVLRGRKAWYIEWRKVSNG